MVKKFKMDNEVGISVNYTVLGVTDIDGISYVVYTDKFPSDNELGVRLLVGKLVSEDPFELERVDRQEQKKIANEFILQVVSVGKEIKK